MHTTTAPGHPPPMTRGSRGCLAGKHGTAAQRFAQGDPSTLLPGQSMSTRGRGGGRIVSQGKAWASTAMAVPEALLQSRRQTQVTTDCPPSVPAACQAASIGVPRPVMRPTAAQTCSSGGWTTPSLAYAHATLATSWGLPLERSRPSTSRSAAADISIPSASCQNEREGVAPITKATGRSTGDQSTVCAMWS